MTRTAEALRLLCALAESLERDADLPSALATIVREVCRACGWAGGESWTPSGEVLRPGPSWFQPGLGGFARRSRVYRFRKGEGLPGRVWASGKPAWVRDVRQDANFPRRDWAKRAGLRAGLGAEFGQIHLGAVQRLGHGRRLGHGAAEAGLDAGVKGVDAFRFALAVVVVEFLGIGAGGLGQDGGGGLAAVAHLVQNLEGAAGSQVMGQVQVVGGCLAPQFRFQDLAVVGGVFAGHQRRDARVAP